LARSEPLKPLLTVALRVFSDDRDEVDAVQAEASHVVGPACRLWNAKGDAHGAES
jgi:hypothetical protein